MSNLYYSLNQQKIVEAHTFISEVKTSVSAAHYPLVQFAGLVLLCPYRATVLDCSRTMATLSHRDTSAPQTLSHHQVLLCWALCFSGILCTLKFRKVLLTALVSEYEEGRGGARPQFGAAGQWTRELMTKLLIIS